MNSERGSYEELGSFVTSIKARWLPWDQNWPEVCPFLSTETNATKSQLQYQYRISNVIRTFSGSGIWLIFTVLKYCANVWDYSNNHQVQWLLWTASSLRRDSRMKQMQDEQQQKNMLRKQMARHLQQGESPASWFLRMIIHTLNDWSCIIICILFAELCPVLYQICKAKVVQGKKSVYKY